MRAEDFILNGRLPDIEYRTEAPEDVVCPRITRRDGVPILYSHNERDADHKDFVPVAEFLRRLARQEPNLACTGYRANGMQTTISFNERDRVTLSPRLQAWLSALAAPHDGKSAAVVGFLANLMPLYTHEDCDGVWCARSLQDGTLVLPVDESAWDDARGTVRVHWQGAAARGTEVDGGHLAALAIERYVRLHGTGATEEAIAAELWHLARHFHFKTDCEAYLPQLDPPVGAFARVYRPALGFGQGVLVNVVSKLLGA